LIKASRKRGNKKNDRDILPEPDFNEQYPPSSGMVIGYDGVFMDRIFTKGMHF